TREHRHIAAEITVPFHAQATPVGQFALGLRHGEACHGKKEARIDTVVARLDALAASHAGRCPFALRLWSIAAPYDVKHTADDVVGTCGRDAGRFYARTDLDTFAAPRAGVEHVLDALAQSCRERDVIHRL